MAGPGFSTAVDRLVAALGRLPGIGVKSAERLAHHLVRCPDEEALELAEAIRGAKQQIRHCQICFHLTEADQPICAICRDPQARPVDRLRRRTIARLDGSRKNPAHSTEFTTSSSAAWLRSPARDRSS